MSYKLEWAGSPNFTPGSQTKAFYGRPRTIEFGAGHWWGDPNAGYSHQGVVNTFLNPARQASAHAVVSAGRVTEMVRDGDTAWCTNNANPFTFAIECDPRMALGGAQAEAIMKTLTEYIADKGYHNLPWRPHKTWFATACNPLDWQGEIMRRAQAEWRANQAPAPTPSNPWAAMATPRKMRAKETLRIINLDNNQPEGAAVAAGTDIDFKQQKNQNGTTYLRSAWATSNNKNWGVDIRSLAEVPPPAPEWQVNLVDIADTKLTVIPAAGTPVVDLNTLKPITTLPRGTQVDIAKRTTVGGKSYLISNYSVANAMPNGILATDLAVPEVPKPDKPEWLENWRDIADVTMYTRADVPLINLLDGSTIKTIPKNTAVEIASATDWHAQQYLITKYSTDKKEARGIALVHLSDTQTPDEPVEPAPEQPTLEQRVTTLERLYAAIKTALAKININLP